MLATAEVSDQCLVHSCDTALVTLPALLCRLPELRNTELPGHIQYLISMSPSIQKAHQAPLEMHHHPNTSALASQAAEYARFMIPTTVHTHMYASVVNAEAAAEAARHALSTAETHASKASAAADDARRRAALTAAAEEQAHRQLALCKAAAAIAAEHHASTVRNLLQLPRGSHAPADAKGEYAGTPPAESPPCGSPRTPPTAASNHQLTSATCQDGSTQEAQDALAIAAATAVARACIQQHMDREGVAGAISAFPGKSSVSAALVTQIEELAVPCASPAGSPVRAHGLGPSHGPGPVTKDATDVANGQGGQGVEVEAQDVQEAQEARVAVSDSSGVACPHMPTHAHTCCPPLLLQKQQSCLCGSGQLSSNLTSG